MRVDEVMFSISPFSLCSSTTGEKSIIEDIRSDNFICGKWTLEPYLPSSTPIHISSEIDEITCFYHFEWSDSRTEKSCSIF